MKELVNKIITNLHIFILLYGLYAGYELYIAHDVQVSEVKNQIPEVEAQIVQTKKKLKEIETFVKKAEEYKLRVEEVAKNIENVQKQLPAETNDSTILTFFQTEMATLNIKEPSLTPGKETTSTYYISKDYVLKAKGTFLQFLIFFERMGNTSRIYNIKDLKLVNTTGSQKGRFQMISAEATIQAYRYNPSFKVDRGFDKLDKLDTAVQ